MSTMHTATQGTPALGDRGTVPWSWWQILKTTVADWQEDKATQLAAALAYYTLFSIAPLLLVATAVAGFAFGDEAVSGQLDQQLQSFLGADGAKMVEEMIASARKPESGVLASVIGVAVLLWGASGVFTQLKDALNTIWEVPAKPGRGWLMTIKDRVLSFAMVLSIGFLLLVSLLMSTALEAAQKWLGNLIPGPDALISVANEIASLLVVALLFALIFRYLPDVRVPWRHVWLGALATAVLFTLGKFLFGLYLGRGAIGSNYGPAGSVIVILLWAYYSSLILFLGAEFTQAHARAAGEEPKTAPTKESARQPA